MKNTLLAIVIIFLTATAQAQNINEKPSNQALSQALSAYQHAENKGKVQHKTYIGIVDFSLPSDQPRFYIYNIKTHQTVLSALVAQGKGSGRGAYARSFSNKPRSEMSSLGLYVTDGVYSGHHKHSIRLIGLQPGVNSNAKSRGIIIHQAWYVNPQFAAKYHRVGNSWGCFSLSSKAMRVALKTMANGNVLYAFDKASNTAFLS